MKQLTEIVTSFLKFKIDGYANQKREGYKVYPFFAKS